MKSVLSHLVITLSDSVLTPFRKHSRFIIKKLKKMISIEIGGFDNEEERERLCEEGFDKEFFWF